MLTVIREKAQQKRAKSFSPLSNLHITVKQKQCVCDIRCLQMICLPRYSFKSTHIVWGSLKNADGVYRSDYRWLCLLWKERKKTVSVFPDRAFVFFVLSGCFRANQRLHEKLCLRTACWKTSTLMRSSWEKKILQRVRQRYYDAHKICLDSTLNIKSSSNWLLRGQYRHFIWLFSYW